MELEVNIYIYWWLFISLVGLLKSKPQFIAFIFFYPSLSLSFSLSLSLCTPFSYHISAFPKSIISISFNQVWFSDDVYVCVCHVWARYVLAYIDIMYIFFLLEHNLVLKLLELVEFDMVSESCFFMSSNLQTRS